MIYDAYIKLVFGSIPTSLIEKLMHYSLSVFSIFSYFCFLVSWSTHQLDFIEICFHNRLVSVAQVERNFEGEDYCCHFIKIGEPVNDQTFGQQVVLEAKTVYFQDANREGIGRSLG